MARPSADSLSIPNPRPLDREDLERVALVLQKPLPLLRVVLRESQAMSSVTFPNQSSRPGDRMHTNGPSTIHNFLLSHWYHVAGVGADEGVEEGVGHMAQQIARLRADTIAMMFGGEGCTGDTCARV